MTTKSKETGVQVVKKDISAQVLDKIETFRAAGELKIPQDYSPENALKSAYLVLSETKNKSGQSALDHCTKESIANALLKMVVWGLSPLKKQCDLIMYGNQLECSIEYTGNIVLAKRYGNLKDIRAQVVFKDDEFEYSIDNETGRTKITKHIQTLENLGSNQIKGAYAVMHFNDGSIDVEVMNIKQIEAAWNQGAMKGNSPAHKNFPDQMCKKTVISRACKLIIRGSDDNILFQDNDSDKVIDTASSDLDHEVNTKANKKQVKFDDVEDAEVVAEEVKSEQKAKEEVQQTEPGF